MGGAQEWLFSQISHFCWAPGGWGQILHESKDHKLLHKGTSSVFRSCCLKAVLSMKPMHTSGSALQPWAQLHLCPCWLQSHRELSHSAICHHDKHLSEPFSQVGEVFLVFFRLLFQRFQQYLVGSIILKRNSLGAEGGGVAGVPTSPSRQHSQ